MSQSRRCFEVISCRLIPSRRLCERQRTDARTAFSGSLVGTVGVGIVLFVMFAITVISASPVSRGDDSTVSIQSSAEGLDSEATKDEPYRPKTKRELRKLLTPLQYQVTQNEGTEPAFRNAYWNNKREGLYKCVVCDQELFASTTKYKSGTGWPSFYAPIDAKRVGTKTDWKLFYSRTEVHCSRCRAHLGHVFDDGPAPTGKRFCMNSASLKFVESDGAKSDRIEEAR